MQEKIIYGVFDGKNMLADDERVYPVPANYASKSKLIDGDGLKLTLTDQGEFIYKQVVRIERKKVFSFVSELNGFLVTIIDEKIYNIPIPSINYFKLKEGDQIISVLAKDGNCSWVAVEGSVN
ncbi:MAG: hypothetical protein RBR97_17720 [Bacteroidales bacterium]|jgi:hypothetical protein|nr:hypothetical protein [Bacteroidales bacterium]